MDQQQAICDLAHIIKDLCCMIGTPSEFTDDAKEWWQNRLKMLYNMAAEIEQNVHPD